MTEYTCISGYLESKTTLQARITAIDAIIDTSLLLLADTASGAGGNVAYYELDDDQVRIKTGYRSIDQVAAGINALTMIKNKWINQLNGRAVTMQDRSTMKGPGYWN
jgi:hypothetical protein